MNKIQNLVLREDSAEWNYNNKKVVVPLEKIEQAEISDLTNSVYVLLKGDRLPSILKIFSETGHEIETTSAPEGFQFYYLTQHPDLGVSIVCVTSNPIEGWRDWHFGYDFNKRSLFRHCPAY